MNQPPLSEAELYEHLTVYLFQDLLAGGFCPGDGSPIDVWHRRKYAGKSGHSHEIDVSFAFELAGIRFLVLVECKRYSQTVNISDVLELKSRIDDIGAQKGIFVTTLGFQAGAERYAEANGIALTLFSHSGFKVLKGFSRRTVLFAEPRFLELRASRSFERFGDLVRDALASGDFRGENP